MGLKIRIGWAVGGVRVVAREVWPEVGWLVSVCMVRSLGERGWRFAREERTTVGL